MCKPDSMKPELTAATSTLTNSSVDDENKQFDKSKQQQQQPSFQLLLSLDSYNTGSSALPTFMSRVVTAVFIIGFLVGMEMLMRNIFYSNKHIHPLLEDETSRHILARHLGVDVLSCGICSLLGFLDRDICAELFTSIFGTTTKGGKVVKPVNLAAYDQRLYTYHAAGYRLSLFFLSYQFKNLYDTIVWNDGPEFVAHHILSIFAASSAMDGCCTYYTLFYFGLSEISTAVLCVLANFDDVHGVPGLADALPVTKGIVAAVFVVLFILCRCIMWPVCTRYFVSDTMTALKVNDDRTKRYKHWLIFLMVACTLLSVLQCAWLIQIFIVAKEELVKAGVI